MPTEPFALINILPAGAVALTVKPALLPAVNPPLKVDVAVVDVAEKYEALA